MKKLIILSLLTTLALADYTQYKPSEDFAKYFTKQNCSQVLDKFYYLNCYDYNYKGTKAVAYKLEAENLKGEQIKKAHALKMIQIYLKNTALHGVIIKTAVMIEGILFLMLQ